MVITVPFTVACIYAIQKVYLRTARQIRLYDLEKRSPVYSHFLETLEGLPTIRAFNWQAHSNASFIIRLDESQRPYYLLFCIQRWLNLVLDLVVAALAVILVALAVQLRNTTSAGLIGVALNNVLGLNSVLSALIREWTQMETSLGAISRIRSFEMDTVPEELPGEDQVPPEKWPERGMIEFHNVTASYG